jgi:hypothetical protein
MERVSSYLWAATRGGDKKFYAFYAIGYGLALANTYGPTRRTCWGPASRYYGPFHRQTIRYRELWLVGSEHLQCIFLDRRRRAPSQMLKQGWVCYGPGTEHRIAPICQFLSISDRAGYPRSAMYPKKLGINTRVGF